MKNIFVPPFCSFLMSILSSRPLVLPLFLCNIISSSYGTQNTEGRVSVETPLLAKLRLGFLLMYVPSKTTILLATGNTYSPFRVSTKPHWTTSGNARHRTPVSIHGSC
jgi:hypothetical protein